MSDTLPTPRTTLHCRYVRVLLTCWSCRHQRDADLAGLIAAGRGDVPLVQLRWRCASCGSRRIDMMCTSHTRAGPKLPARLSSRPVFLRDLAPGLLHLGIRHHVAGAIRASVTTEHQHPDCADSEQSQRSRLRH